MRPVMIATFTAFTLLTLPFGMSAQSSERFSDPAAGMQSDPEHLGMRHSRGVVDHYRPCPANVEFANGHHACLGMPM